MNRRSTPLLLVLCLALLAGCSASSSDTGSAQFAVALPQALSSSISRVSVTASGADFPSFSMDLVSANGVWGGYLGGIPAGAHRSFLAQAFDSSGTRLFEESASGVSISAEQTSLVAITLQQLNAPPPFQNEAPLVDSLVAPSTSVPAGGALSLTATAHDSNPGDTLSYAWTSTAGSFSSTSAATTTWTAPSSIGIQTLTVTVTDAQGVSSSMSLGISVTPNSQQGTAQISISFSSFPQVDSLTASPTQLAVGQTTTVSASASDLDGDSLSYAWSASCSGSWTHASSRSAQFTPDALPAGACNNCRLTVSVSDGRGGQSTATLALCVSTSPAPQHFNPYFLSASSSSDTASPSQVLTFEVVASDPEGSALSFSWAATTGSLGTAANTASSSRITWTAPSCATENVPPRLTATATNAFNLTATKSFGVTGLPVCVPGWALTGAMASSRSNHTATLLNNGKVLVAGGINNGLLASAEVYDPASGTWSATGSMTMPRRHHTATLLPNGKVLVAGGYSSGFSAEVYDPASGTWSATGSMALFHWNHTATLLPNDKVLVAGGDYTTAEVYDPASGTWSTTGSMVSVRRDHTATLLPNGKVLLSGGYNGGAIAKAEVYDPALGTWSATGLLTSYRFSHTATLLPNGKALVSGGYNVNSLAAAEVYDPASGTWSAIGSMASPRDYHTATLLPDGKVLVAGGRNAGSPSLTAELYTP